MPNLKPLLIVLLLILGRPQQISGQTVIDSLESHYQSCLDKGDYMLGCTKTFYQQLDSLLNLYYRNLRLTCDSVEKENLKDDQFEWLRERDSYFKKNLIDFKKKNPNSSPYGSSFGSQDDAMVMFDLNARFVKERVIMMTKIKNTNFSAENYKVNPTGFYDLDNKTEIRNGDTYGYFGDIEVKKISATKAVIRLFVCKGAPSYNSGEAFDTLEIKNNIAIYKFEEDASCKIFFRFYKRGIEVNEVTENYNFGCGFGHAVTASGFYKRKSYKVPSDKELIDN